MNHSCSFAGTWEVHCESWHPQQLQPTKVCATHLPGMMESLTSILAQVWSQTFHLVLAELEVSSGTNGNIFIFLNRQSLQHQSSSSFNFLKGFACPNCIFNFMFHYRWNVIKVSAPFVPTSSCFLISNQKKKQVSILQIWISEEILKKPHIWPNQVQKLGWKYAAQVPGSCWYFVWDCAQLFTSSASKLRPPHHWCAGEQITSRFFIFMVNY